MLDFVLPRMDLQMFSLFMLVLACVEQSLASCVVDSFTVKEDFDAKRVSREMSEKSAYTQNKDPVYSSWCIFKSAVCRKVVRTAEERSRGSVSAGQHLGRIHCWR